MKQRKSTTARSSNVRFVILVLSLVLSTSMYCNQQALSFTVICMQDVVESQATNATEVHWLENPTKKNALFSVVAVGQLIGIIPVVPLMHAIGLRYTLAFYGIVTACGTLALPLAVELGHVFVMMSRILQGFAMAMAFVSVGAITSHWSVLRKSGTYIAILSCSPQLSCVLTMPIASAFCESSLGWRSLYYSLGAVCLVSVVAFTFLYRDNPKDHWMVNEKELLDISTGKEGQFVKDPVPYKEICMDRCMQAVLLSTFSGNTAFFIFLHFGPTFMNKALGLDISDTGLATAAPYAVCLALKFVAGPLFDALTFISEKNRMIMFASLSQGVVMLGFLVLSQTSDKLIAQIAFSAALAFNGLNIVGTIKCAQVVARQHIHFVIVVITLGACLICFLLPVVVAGLCPTNSMDEWSRLFLGTGLFVIVANLPFLFLARSDPAPWTKPRALRLPNQEDSKENGVDHRIYPVYSLPKGTELTDVCVSVRSERNKL